MLDGIYQSVFCFFITYLLFRPATFVSESGLDLGDNSRMGVYGASATIIAVDVYVLMNMYRWDWLMVLLTSISILLIWFWTGVYTATPAAAMFYQAAPQVYGQLSFWLCTLLTVSICLAPRFFIKSIQKIYFPLDVDIIREQVRQGKFAYLDKYEAYVPPAGIKNDSASSSDVSAQLAKKTSKHPTHGSVDEDQRPIYPPSVAATGTTHPSRSQNGSDGTDYTGHKSSLERPYRPTSFERPRPSFDRLRSSMDRIRPSFEASDDFTSAALLTRMESSHSIHTIPSNTKKPPPHGQSNLR